MSKCDGPCLENRTRDGSLIGYRVAVSERVINHALGGRQNASQGIRVASKDRTGLSGASGPGGSAIALHGDALAVERRSHTLWSRSSEHNMRRQRFHISAITSGVEICLLRYRLTQQNAQVRDAIIV